MTKDDDIRERDGGQYFKWLVVEENPRVETEARDVNQRMVRTISEKETEDVLMGMKSATLLYMLFNYVMTSEHMPSAWKHGILVTIFKRKVVIQESMNNSGVKLLAHTFRIRENRRKEYQRMYVV